jgi:hypothetical protein
MSEFVEGNVVICGTQQAGSIIHTDGRNVWVLLRNGNIWVGFINQIRMPQDQADLDACPLDVERAEKPRT